MSDDNRRPKVMLRVHSFAIKAAIRAIDFTHFAFSDQKTMYRGKEVATGDQIFLFASENEGGRGLFACGIVIGRNDVPRTAAARQTPRVSIQIALTASAKRPLGRTELRAFKHWTDGQPETELNFKLYRQATNKIVGLTSEATDFLTALF